MSAFPQQQPPKVEQEPGELLPPDSPLTPYVWVHPDRRGGTPCFRGSRVGIFQLFQYLKGGESIDDFLEAYPPLTRDHVQAVITLAEAGYLKELQQFDYAQ